MLYRIAIVVISLLMNFDLVGQVNVIDLGTDTIHYDADFEYIVAFESVSYMESYVFYQSAMQTFKKGDLVSAKAFVSKAIKLNKQEEKFKMLKAWIVSKEGSYKKAIKMTSKIIEASPLNKEAHYCRALNNYLLKQYLNANSGFSRLIELYDLDVQAYYGRAETKMKLEDIQGAINDYTTALMIRPTMVASYKGRGIAYLSMYDFKQALIDFNQAITVNPKDGELYYYRGICYLRLNDYGNACKNFEQALKFDYKQASEYFSKNCKF